MRMKVKLTEKGMMKVTGKGMIMVVGKGSSLQKKTKMMKHS